MDEEDIVTPVRPIELPEPDAEPEPEPEPETVEIYPGSLPENRIRCKGTKKNGDPCNGWVYKDGLCLHHQPKVEPEIIESTEAPVPERKGPGRLLPYPFHDGGVSENAAIRVIRMVQPQCPVDPLPEIKQKDGTYRPNPNYTGEQNCQQVYKKNNNGVWDVEKCMSLGHDPWHTTFRRPILEEVVDENGFVTDTKVRYHVEHRLNIIQVSLNPRHTNGMEVALAQAKGCKFLEDFNIASPCEFRNCSQPQRIDTRYGKYCSERHARLVAADARKMMLPIGGDPYTETQAFDEREQMLESINIRKGG